MVTAFAKEFTTAFSQMPDEIHALHTAISMGSRITLAPISPLKSSFYKEQQEVFRSLV